MIEKPPFLSGSLYENVMQLWDYLNKLSEEVQNELNIIREGNNNDNSETRQ